MCDCVRDKKNREIKVRIALAKENKTGVPYGVYVIKGKGGHSYFYDEPVEAIKKKGKEGIICCYFNTSGVNIELEKVVDPKPKPAPKKKDDKKV